MTARGGASIFWPADGPPLMTTLRLGLYTNVIVCVAVCAEGVRAGVGLMGVGVGICFELMGIGVELCFGLTGVGVGVSLR